MIFRHAERKRWTVVDRETVNDSRLSYRARGVLVWLLDKPDGWDSDSEAISHEGTEGRDAIRTVLRELESCGYLKRVKRQVAGGRWITETDIYERPTTGFQASDNRASDGQALRDQVLTTNTKEPDFQQEWRPAEIVDPDTNRRAIEDARKRVGAGRAKSVLPT